MTRARETGRWLAVLALFLLLVALPVASPAQECRISVNTSFDQLYPDISGSRIVWQDSNDNNLRLFDLSTGIETELTAGSNQHTLPVIDGPLVAWLENPFAPYQVTLLNLTAGTTRILSASGYSPDISGDRVIWQDSGGTPGIALFNSADGSQGMVVTGPSDQTQPAISGDMVTWVNGSSSEQIYGKSLSTGDETLVAQTSCSNPPCIIDTAISGNRVAWSDYRDDFDRDLYFTDSGSLVEKLVADYPVDQTSPAIDGDRIVWMNGTDLWLGDLTGANPSVPITAGSGNYRPKISGDRIVWYKDVGGKKDIYLETVGSSLACPGAAYTANTTSGLSPLTVQFTDTSTGSPGHWLWEFGDGTTSTDENPVHAFASDGSYSIALTVSSPVGRDYTTRADSIRVGPVPMVSFTVNQTYGIAPLPARFTDTSSGSPTGWSWDFGDGATSADRNPTHTYLAPGNYTVNLSATNALGTGTASSPALIRVLNGVSLVSVANFDGLTVTDTGGREEIVLDTTKMAGDTFDPATPASFTFTPPPSAGWQRMTFSSTDGFGFSRDAGGIITGNLSSCTLESSAIVPGTFTTGAGNNLPLSYRLDFAAYPRDAAINATVWEGVTPADDTAFRTTLVTTSRDFTSVLGTAYTLSFVSQNLPPVSGATLNVSVNAAWVQKYGNENNIALVRLGGDGIDETLNPSATFTDGTLDYFTVPSPHGLSRFGLVAAEGSSNLIQMGARLATQYIQGGQTGHSSNDYSGPSAGPPASSRNLAQEGRPAATYYGEGKVDTTVAGVARGTVIVESADRGAGISIGEGTIALDASGAPLASATALAVSGPVPAIPQEPGVQFTGRAYDLGPNGATFSPPATVSFTVPEDQWRQDASYLIRSYSASAGTWEDIPTSADPGTRTVSGSVSHLCVFGLFTVAAAAPPAQAPPAAVPAAPPAQVPRTPMGTFSGLIGWISAAALGHAPVSLTVLLVGIGSLYTWTRRSWLARYRTWVTLYLASLTGLLWASFRLSQGGPIPEALFIAITVVGLNLIVHVFRFDRITITRRAAPRYAMPARRW